MERNSVKAAFILALSLVLVCTILRGELLPAQAQLESTGRPLAISKPALDQGTIGLPTEAPAGWWTTVQEDIRQSEYRVTWQDQTYLPDLPAAYQAPNRAHNLRTYFTPTGIRVIPRTDGTPSWQWGLALTGYGYAGDVRPAAPAELVADTNRIEYRRRGPSQDSIEWYLNDERGLEQSFTLTAPPRSTASKATSEIVLELALTGALTPNLSESKTAVEFTTPGGVRVLRYGDLTARDSTGRPLELKVRVPDTNTLPQNMQHKQNEQYVICIDINAANAIPPITVNALFTSPSWTAESNQDSADFGRSVSTAGDVNGDGFSDVIVGAPWYDGGQEDEGRASVYYGSITGLDVNAAWTAEGNQANARFSHSVGIAGDVNGDGFADIVIGAPWFSSGQADNGQAHVYYGSASGLGQTAGWSAEGDQADARFGYAVSTAGDVNGDGFSDVIISAYHYDNVQTNEGRVYVYHGSASGLSRHANWATESNQNDAKLGWSVGTAGDVNGDGYTDVIIGAREFDGSYENEGRAYVYHGSAAGLDSAPAWTTYGNQTGAMFAQSVGTAGDVNGDGYADVIVGAFYYDAGQTDEGQAFVYHGSASGLSRNPAWTAEGDQTGAWLGFSVATAGDVNGDGYADVVIGSIQYDDNAEDEGQAFVYWGSATGLKTLAAWATGSHQADSGFGRSVGSAGDVNGDGYADIIVGAPYFSNGQTSEGRAFVYYGSASGPSTTPGWTTNSNQSGAMMGYSADTAGDVNGDGYADVIVGAYSYDGGQTDEGRVYAYYGSASGLKTYPAWTQESDHAYAGFGWSVSTAGDVNGDGFDDIIVGAPQYDDGQKDEGWIFVHYGSSTGLLAGPAGWTADSDQANSSFGWSVGTAGDVNGDGYADVIIGAPRYYGGQKDEGRAYLYTGSALGLTPFPVWAIESNQAYARFGDSVSTAGDVNGDGYTDIVIGASGYTSSQASEGQAFVYHGSISGPSPSPDWSVESNQAEARLGLAVSTAGDVNGDGYSEVIIGAGYFDDGQEDEGKVFLYQGSARGLGSTATWTAESDQVGATFGQAVSTAGDVNGDGYADVIVGAPLYDTGRVDEGQAFVYCGSAYGLNPVADWFAGIDQDEASFGYSVGTAGDVNGDGYADVIVGAPLYDAGQVDEGQVTIYYGNQGPGLSLIPHQRNSDGSAPIAHLGRSKDNSIHLAALARTPFGRGKVKLEWEVEPLGTPFDGKSAGQSNTWTDTDTSSAQINELVGDLQHNTPYHWRVRIRYHPATAPFQQYSRWVTMPWNGWAEQDFRTPVAIYLPALLHSYSGLSWDDYYEDNDDWLKAYGPLDSGRMYQAFPDDSEDYYYFELQSHSKVSIYVNNYAPTSTRGQLQLWGPATNDTRGNLVDAYLKPGETSMSLGPHTLPPGKYYVRVRTDGAYSSDSLYMLSVTY